MIVPLYWAQAERQIAQDNSRLKIRRFGWSDDNEAAAQQHAEDRLNDAIEQIATGEETLLREPKVAYNGADGLPIREEIISRHDDAVVTRNGYGALCLNTPNILFADVDAPATSSCSIYFYTLFVYAAAYGFVAFNYPDARSIWLFLLGSLFFVTIFGSSWHWAADRLAGNPKDVARRRIEKFSRRSPNWGLRLYETPLGWRILVTHSTFDPRSDEVSSFFREIGTDPVYVRMCFNQNCFRARVSPKPWRIGIDGHLRPRPGVWPVSAERLPDRVRWVRDYDAKAKRFAACRFDASFGNPRTCPEAAAIIRVHDSLSGATSSDPIA